MPFELQMLPYAETALSPVISAETIEFHYGKHHASYVQNLNKLTTESAMAEQTLEHVVCTAEGALFNNAAQVWNHDFYWASMTPTTGTAMSADLEHAVTERFGSSEELKKRFIASATGDFGSGWTWLVRTLEGGLEVVNTSNAATLLTGDNTALLVCDVWEHAYYIDYRNARPRYLEAWWELVDWTTVSQRYSADAETRRLAS